MKNGIDQSVVDETLKDLDALAKSMTEDKGKGEGDLEALEKAAKEAEKGKDKEKDKSKEKEDEEEGEGEGGDGEGEDGGAIEKALQDEIEGELVKASEAYASLEKAVSDGMADMKGQIETLMKSVESVVKINVAQAKVIGALTKSVREMGGTPTPGSRTHLGKGKEGGETQLQKSKSEIQGLLKKAVEDEKIAPFWLGKFASHGEACLTPEVKQAAGIC